MQRRAMMMTVAATAATLALAGCTTNKGASATPSEKRAEINKGVDETLATLYSSVPGSRELVAKSRGVLVFPSVIQAAFGIGGEYGEGALRVDGATTGYYSTASGSFGFQAGAQSRALIYLFMTQEALDKFRSSNGWTAGADASVSLIKVGANGMIDTSSVSNSVNAFALTNAGLFGGVNLNGSKISKKDV
jgi:lipid-binding SYLF domain-containing protein